MPLVHLSKICWLSPASAGLLVQMDLGRLECKPLCVRVGSDRQTQENCIYDERMSDGYLRMSRVNTDLRVLRWMFVVGSRTKLSFSLNFRMLVHGIYMYVHTTAVCGCSYLNRISPH